MEFKFQKSSEIKEFLNPDVFVDKLTSYHKVIANANIAPKQMIYSGFPFMELKMNPNLSISQNFLSLQNHIAKNNSIWEQCYDLFSELCPRSFDEISSFGCNDKSQPKEDEDDDDEMKKYKNLDKMAFTQKTIALKTLSNCFGNNDRVIVFKTMSNFNHSCVPNCLVICDKNHHMMVISIKEIKKGEELTISFNDNYIFDDTERRKALILSQRKFVCNCKACENVTYNVTPTVNYQKHYPTDIVVDNSNRVIIPNLSMCFMCGQKGGLRGCSGCHKTLYCSHICQKKHWKLCHKKTCVIMG